MGLSERTKGATGEREVVKLLASHGITCQRNLSQYQASGVDIICGGLAIEVKRRRETISISERNEWWGTTIINAKDLIPVLLWRSDRRGWWCRLPAIMTDFKWFEWTEQPIDALIRYMKGVCYG